MRRSQYPALFPSQFTPQFADELRLGQKSTVMGKTTVDFIKSNGFFGRFYTCTGTPKDITPRCIAAGFNSKGAHYCVTMLFV